MLDPSRRPAGLSPHPPPQRVGRRYPLAGPRGTVKTFFSIITTNHPLQENPKEQQQRNSLDHIMYFLVVLGPRSH